MLNSCGWDLAKGNRREDDNSIPPEKIKQIPLKPEFNIETLHPCQTRSCQRTTIDSNELDQIYQKIKSNHNDFDDHIDRPYPLSEIKLLQFNPEPSKENEGELKFKNNCFMGMKSSLELNSGESTGDNISLNFNLEYLERTTLDKNEFCQKQLASLQTEKERKFDQILELTPNYLLTFLQRKFHLNQDSIEFAKLTLEGKEYLELKLVQTKKRSNICLTYKNPRICYSLNEVDKNLTVLIDLGNHLPFPSLYFYHYSAFQKDNLLAFHYQLFE